MATTWVRQKKSDDDAVRQVAPQLAAWRDTRDDSLVGPGTAVTLGKAVDGLDCAPAGRQGHLSNEANGEARVVLPCGHVVYVDTQDLVEIREGTFVRADSVPASEEAKEKPMPKAKKAIIPNSKGVIPVQGLEEQVKKFKTAYMFFKQLETSVEEQKVEFRALAQKTAGDATSVPDRVEFLAEDGSCVQVSFPDITKAGNRTNVSDKAISEILQLGIDPSALDIFETEIKIVLAGPWVDWFKSALTAQFGAGAPMPEGVEEKTVRKLTEKGAAMLKQMAKEAKTDNERKAAEMLYSSGTKSPSVGVR